jgi:hypothetical protein
LQCRDRRIEHPEQDLFAHWNPHQLAIGKIADRGGIPLRVMHMGDPDGRLVDGDDRNEFGAEARPQVFEEDGPKQRIDGGVVNFGDHCFQWVGHDEPNRFF